MKNSPHIHTHIVRILNAHSLVTADKDTSFPSLLVRPERKLLKWSRSVIYVYIMAHMTGRSVLSQNGSQRNGVHDEVLHIIGN